jgi:hypothetical protein
MADSARIHDFEALKEARAALADFAEQVSTALASVDADIERVAHWLKVDRPTYWKLEARRREEEIERAKGEIMRKRIIAAPDPASVSLEERRLARAKARVEEARRKLDKVRRWMPVWEREAMLYKTSTRSLTEALHADIPRALAILSRMMETLDHYAALAPPAGDPEPAPESAAAPESSQAGENTAGTEQQTDADRSDADPPSQEGA